MNTTSSRFLSSSILMVWGVIFTYFYFSGRVGSYLHPVFHIYTALSGIVLCMLAVALLFTKSSENQESCHSGPSFGWQIFSAFVLIVPLVFAIPISRSEFGATAIMNRKLVENIKDLPVFSPPTEPALPTAGGSGGEGTTDAASYLPKNEKGDIKAETVDLLYAASEPTMRDDFENKEVEVVGQFMPARSGNAKGDRFNIIRMFIMCCAADARPVGIAVQTSEAKSFPEMTWVKVTGKATFPIESGRRAPLIIADSVAEVSPPAESFIY